MVNLTKIYTRTGDEGTTGLSDFSRVSKTDPRIAAYADVDEANSAIGVALAGLAAAEQAQLASLNQTEAPAEQTQLVTVLKQIQNELFDLGADLATPLATNYKYPPLRVGPKWVAVLEVQIDFFNQALPKLDSFILPGGTLLAANLHLARTIVRRAERSVWTAIETYGSEVSVEEGLVGGVSIQAAQYLNRLSDLLFVLARYANLQNGGDVRWVPGANRA